MCIFFRNFSKNELLPYLTNTGEREKKYEIYFFSQRKYTSRLGNREKYSSQTIITTVLIRTDKIEFIKTIVLQSVFLFVLHFNMRTFLLLNGLHKYKMNV